MNPAFPDHSAARRRTHEMLAKENATETAEFVVWGCGAWPQRNQVVDLEDGMDTVTDDMPEFDLLPATFVREWGEVLGSEHWAELITCSEAKLDAATRGVDTVYGYAAL